MGTKTVLVMGQFAPLKDAQKTAILEAAPDADVRFFDSQEALEAEVESADVIAGHISADALARARRLTWIHCWAAGPDELLYPEMVASPVVVTSSKGNGAVPLAEHAIMLMLMLNRDALLWIEAQRERRWARRPHGELNGLTCGIIGLGHSGQDLALKCKAFHMRTLGLRRGGAAAAHVDEMMPPARLYDLLARSDFVVMTAPLTAETKGMLGEAEFRAMKPSAHYICFSRGGIADDDALLKALREGWIAGAGLDAHGTEPLPPDSPFWDLPNTIITPHNGATTPMTRQRGIDIFIENLRNDAAGRPLRNVVDKRAGY
ncbi:MAG: D-2-hydroxyacid dehydrogenase [Inquilinaceae bacterium]